MIADVNLQDGDALAFLGTFQTPAGELLRHLCVYEAFSMRRDQIDLAQSMGDPQWWCDNGPQELGRQIDAAIIWRAQAAHPPTLVPNGFEKTLEDHKVVRLVAISRPSQWLFCWWDALGKSVNPNLPTTIDTRQMESPGWVDIQSDEGADWKREQFAGLTPGQRQQTRALYQHDQQFKLPDGDRLAVGVPVGAWRKIGELALDGATNIDGTTYRIDNVRDRDDGFFCAFIRDGGPDDSVYWLTAITRDGKEIDAWTDRGMTDQRASGQYRLGLNFQGTSSRDVDHINIMRRKMQWVTFRGFAKNPNPPPVARIDAADLARAEAKTVQ